MVSISIFLKRQRLRAVSPYIHGNVLDVGCGITEAPTVLRPDQHYVGIDSDPMVIRWFSEKYPAYESHQRNLDTDEFALDRTFDTILMLAVIEHLKHPDKVLAQIRQYLKPEGRLLITTPSPVGDVIHRLGARIGLFSTRAMEQHATIFTHDTLQARLEHNKLRVILYRRFLLGGNQLFVCQPV